ncbi:hypothetical protein [Nitrosomonas eutropha]|uniref:hypothetical protein n=1 Tax=Nitrosomonas eutropha TaxID=916 RepID=UPI0021087A7E|nr:hypothetical protein [Nitrosomonas eutropha]
MLWLDIAPDSGLFPRNSTRNYLLRVTTKAHPWGFNVDELRETKRLSAEQAKQSLEAFNCNKSVKNGERPHPIQGWPYVANAPVPLAWLLIEAQSILEESGTLITPEKSVELWRKVKERCRKFIEGRNPLPSEQLDPRNRPLLVHWAYRVQEILETWLEQPQAPQLLALAEALARAVSTQLMALLVPVEALTQPSRNEEGQSSGNNKPATTDRIANVEHLFQRLNAGGTELRGNDLAYSMIKAYWPGIEKTIQNIETRPPETQVALLGAQLALATDDDKLPPPLNVTTLRTLARIDDGQQPSDDSKKMRQGELDRIKTMFALKGQVSSEAPIKLALQRLDKWFLYDDVNRDQRWGLPPVLRSRMAEQAPEVFLFLLRLTHHTTQEPEPDVRRKLLGLSTALHWFSQDRQRAVRWLWETSPAEWCDGSAFFKNQKPLLTQLHELSDDQRHKTMANILTPEQLSDYISIDTFNEDSIGKWRWWDTLVTDQAKKEGKTADERQAKYGGLIKILKDYNYRNNNGLLLMYAQREQMASCFPNYDSSHIGYWDAHNVPWDFDHILPQSAFADMRTENDLMEVCKQWGNTIANLHIYPFEKNRSRQDEKANKSLPRDESTRMLLNPFELDTFSLETKDIRFNKDKPQNSEAPRKVYEFVLAARTRLLRIYGEWYDNLLIGHLLQSDNQSTISQTNIAAND